MTDTDFLALLITIKLATISTLILVLLSIPLAWILANSTSRLKPFYEAIIALPLVLPPTVLGFYLLIVFSPNSPVGSFWNLLFDHQLAFSFNALVIGSVIYSLPFVVQPIQSAFEQYPRQLLEAASTMGASKIDQFINLVIPDSKRAIIAAAGLGFAHTIGEFGIVLMIGGNIPGETQVLSIALFDHVESLNYQSAHIIAAGLMAFSLIALVCLYSISRNYRVKL